MLILVHLTGYHVHSFSLNGCIYVWMYVTWISYTIGCMDILCIDTHKRVWVMGDTGSLSIPLIDIKGLFEDSDEHVLYKQRVF